ncbi:hypothetical protein [Ramlibacter henchirensis]|nr:hypothetical protein [Ramlibacter henchirensis]
MDAHARKQAGARWLAFMRAGDWESAWRETDSMEADRRAGRVPRDDAHLYWDGTSPEGRSVLIRCEHGLGDTLQFLRFIPAIAHQAGELHFMVQPPFVPLLRGAPGLGQVHNGWLGPNWPAHEVELEVMELAYALRATTATVLPPYPHLAAQAQRLAPVALAHDGRPRVGLLWAASDWDTSRSIPWSCLEPLLALPRLRFFSLQQGRAADQAMASRLPIEPLHRHTAGVEAAASAMLQMDLVISIDGMPAHLAATLGRPTWLLLKHEADWRWMDGRSDSPWYPTMRIFRQPQPGDWEDLMRDVIEAAEQLRPKAQGLPAAGRAQSVLED